MGKRLYVGNLSTQTSDESLKQLFAGIGSVEMVRVMTDKGISRGFGFVEMGNEREALNAIKTLNGSELDGNSIVVNEATPPGGRNSDSGFGRPNRRFSRT
jgi:RNA recognition motif-containing protein